MENWQEQPLPVQFREKNKKCRGDHVQQQAGSFRPLNAPDMVKVGPSEREKCTRNSSRSA
jgi:hypothetical protein